MLSEVERDQIYAEPKEIDADTITWEMRGQGRFYLKAPVRRSNGEEMTIRAYFNSSTEKYSFALLYRGTILIRRWDFHYHENPGQNGEKFRWEPHKHKWTQDFGEELAYPVADVPTNDVEKALYAFLKECNIKIVGPIQNGLFSS